MLYNKHLLIHLHNFRKLARAHPLFSPTVQKRSRDVNWCEDKAVERLKCSIRCWICTFRCRLIISHAFFHLSSIWRNCLPDCSTDLRLSSAVSGFGRMICEFHPYQLHFNSFQQGTKDVDNCDLFGCPDHQLWWSLWFLHSLLINLEPFHIKLS